jgi:hypothetical protein
VSSRAAGGDSNQSRLGVRVEDLELRSHQALPLNRTVDDGLRIAADEYFTVIDEPLTLAEEVRAVPWAVVAAVLVGALLWARTPGPRRPGP